MALLKSTLKTELQKFLDDKAGNFEDYSADTDEFKTNMETALTQYLSPILTIAPPTILPNNTQIDTSSSPASFTGELILDVGVDPPVFNDEISKGWEKMISSAVLNPSGDYLGGAVNPLISITPLITATGKASIKIAITGLESSFNEGEEACDIIADAIHSEALLAFVTVCSYAIPSSPPGVGPLAFG